MKIDSTSSATNLASARTARVNSVGGERLYGGGGIQGYLTQTDIDMFSAALGREIHYPSDELMPMAVGLLAHMRAAQLKSGGSVDMVGEMFKVNAAYQRSQGMTMFSDEIICTAMQFYGQGSSAAAHSFTSNGGRGDLYA